MRHLFTTAAAALLLSAASAWADPFYASILGGGSFDPALRLGSSLQDMNTGYNVGGRIGYSLDGVLPMQGWAVEADGFYNASGFKANNSQLASTSAMGDLVYHLNLGWPIGIYGGGGIGAVNDSVGGTHGSSTVLGWQALGGVEFPVSHDMTLFTEYRYQNAHDANIAGVGPVGNTSNNVSIGMKFSL